MDTALKEPFDREKQFASKRRAVILAAGQVFRRRGYHNASMAEIAKNLGLTKAALYYYVRNKELRAKSEAASALDKLEALYIDFVNMLTASGVSLLTDVNSLGIENKMDVLARRGKIERKIIRLVKEGQKDGFIRTGDARLHVFFFMGALNWLREDIAAHFALQMRAGIRS